MKRLFLMSVLVILISGIAFPATAQEPGLEATVAALQTQVVALQTQVANLAADEVPSTVPAPASSTSTVVPVPTPASGVAPIGEMLRIGDFEFAVTSVSTQTELPDSSGFLSYDANKGVWLIVTLRIRNLGNASQDFPFVDFVVEETYGARYETDTLIWPIYFGDEYNNDELLIPGNWYELKTLFDVPLQAKGLKYKHKDEPISIDLGR